MKRDEEIMSTGQMTPGHEMEQGSYSEAASVASEPVAWTPPVPQTPPQPTSFNPRAGVTQPTSTGPLAQHPAPQHAPASPYAHPQAFAAPAPQAHMAPNAYAQDYGHAYPGEADYGTPEYAPVSPPPFSAMGRAQEAVQSAAYSDPYAMPPAYDAPEPLEEKAAKSSRLSRFKLKPKAATQPSGGVISAAPQPGDVAEAEDQAKSSSSKTPFLMGVLTGIAMMLGVGFLLGGDPEPAPAYYAPSPTADTMAPPDAPLAFVETE